MLSGQFEVPFALGATAANVAILIGLAGVLQPARPAPPPGGGLRRAAAVLVVLLALPALGLLLLRLPASAWLHQADAASANGDADGALELYGRVARLRTGSYYPESRMAAICQRRGDKDAALLHVRAARRLWPWGAELMEQEGDILMQLGRPGEAVESYALAVETSPTRDTSFFRRVHALDQAGRLQEAIDLLQYRVRSSAGSSIDLVQAVGGHVAPPRRAGPDASAWPWPPRGTSTRS